MEEWLQELVILSILVLILSIFCWAGIKFCDIIAFDVIEEAAGDADFKGLLSDVLTNAGLVSALVLGVACGMLTASPTDGTTSIAWGVYTGCCFLSVLFAVQGVTVSVFALMYTQGLSSDNCKLFFHQYPYSVGFPCGAMITACVLLMLQSTIYASIVSCRYFAVYASLTLVFVIHNIAGCWNDFATFKAADVDDKMRQARREGITKPESRGLSHYFAPLTRWLSSRRRRRVRLDGEGLGAVRTT